MRAALLGVLSCVAGLAPGAPPLWAERPEEATLEEDWRKQDGIGTPRAPSAFAAAVERTLDRGDALLAELVAARAPVEDIARSWQALRQEFRGLRALSRGGAAGGSTSEGSASEGPASEGPPWEDLWRRVHLLRRRIVFSNPLAPSGPIAFLEQVPGIFSHQLTQYYGSCARPGGGVLVLDAPGRSLRSRRLAPDALPPGSYQHLDVSFDGKKILFSYCHAETVPPNRESCLDRFYHLYEMAADSAGENAGDRSGDRIGAGSPGLRQLTSGPYDDFAGRYLPGGRIAFISTRRGGYHRCGRGPCPVYTLALCEADGSDPRTISYHETHEWDPAVLNDGRLIYTRWDYVDRNAVFYQQLWSARPDGSDARIFYGNNTFNPVGVWEPRPVPGSSKVMATAGAHHAMTAGSIILVDVARGIDGLDPIVRLTPDALFPESEVPVARLGQGTWHAPVGVSTPPAIPPEAERWPGHCYRTPYPLSESLFLAAYSFESLIGEPDPNPPAMFGLYLVDRFGNKELLHRDPEISSLWPMPLLPRARPPELPSQLELGGRREGTFLLQDVRRGLPPLAPGPLPPLAPGPSLAPGAPPGPGPALAPWPPLSPGTVKRLRIVQVLPKTTWHANDPPVGMANASPGKQVLGTVPVEPDGSAFFRAPAGIPLSFQALDERGEAIQVMRSVAYLQPGERTSCIGCHEPRSAAPSAGRVSPPLALARDPSAIEPGPDGSNPLSYPILVQPVLDEHCVRCHGAKVGSDGEDPGGGVVLTGAPQGRYTASYNALAPRVPYSDWAGRAGDFREVNSEPLTRPGFFGARGSALMRLLRAGHHDVSLEPDDWERLATWMDSNALFYGTFDPADQARQLRGERIAGPKLQ